MADLGTGSMGSSTGSEAQRAASQAAGRGQEAIQHAASKVKDLSSQAAGQIGGHLRAQAEQHQQTVKGALNTLADKLNETKDQVDSQWINSLVGQAASSLQSAARYVESGRPDQMLSDFTAFARRNPIAIVGGALAVGFVLARAGRVAASELSRSSDSQGFTGEGFENSGYSTGYAPPTDGSSASVGTAAGAPRETSYVGG